MMREAAALTLMLMAFSIGPRIRDVPRTVDHAFTTRLRLCNGAPDNTVGAVQANEAKLSLADLLGSELIELQVHQIGKGFGDFNAAADHIRAGVHACFQDRTGTFWWVRVAAGDVWP
jgi:hypothetical protein